MKIVYFSGHRNKKIFEAHEGDVLRQNQIFSFISL